MIKSYILISLFSTCIISDLYAIEEKSADKMIGFWQLQEGTGSIAKDSSGNGNDGIIHGATWHSSPNGIFLEFDGINDYISFNSKAFSKMNNSFSIEFEITPYKSSNYNARIISKSDSGTGKRGGYQFSVFQGGTDICILLSNGKTMIRLSGPLEIKKNNHILIKWSGKFLELSINGKVAGKSTLHGPLTPKKKENLYIGRNLSGAFFNGIIKNVKISETSTSEKENEKNYIVPLRNNSFIVHTNPDLPDFWGNETIAGYYPGWESTSCQIVKDKSFPISDVLPLRLEVPAGKNLNLNYGFFEYAPWLCSDSPYTFSIYMKGEDNKLPVKIKIANNAKTFNLSNAWKRYSYTFSFPDKSRRGIISISLPQGNTYWIAAPQLESGKNTTTFTPTPAHLSEPISTNNENLNISLSSSEPFSPNKNLLELKSEYSYYTREKEATMLIKWNFQEKSRISIFLKNKNGDLISLKNIENSSCGSKLFNISLEKVPMGQTEILAKAYIKNKLIAIAQTSLYKHTPKAIEVKINHFKRSLYLNGVPYFFYCMNWSSPIRKTGKIWQLEDIKQKGFTCIRIPVLEKTSDLLLLNNKNGKYWKFLDQCHKTGLSVIIGFQPETAIPGGRASSLEIHKDAVTKAVNLLKEHPAIIAWNFIDEPEGLGNTGKSYWEETGKNESDLIELFKAVKSNDPYRPAFINYGVNVWNKKSPYGGNAAFDIGSVDIYPIGHTNPAFYPPSFSQMIKEIRCLNSNCMKQYKPTHFFAQLSWLGFREPIPQEEKFMSYINLIYGTRLFSYFTYKPMSATLWNYMSSLAHELKILIDITTLEDFKELKHGKNKDAMHYSIWKTNKKIYLLIANASYKIQNLKIKLSPSEYQKISAATLLFKNRTIEIKSGLLCDTFEPLECKVYELHNIKTNSDLKNNPKMKSEFERQRT